MPNFVTIQKAAEDLGINPQAVRRLVKKLFVPVLKEEFDKPKPYNRGTFKSTRMVVDLDLLQPDTYKVEVGDNRKYVYTIPTEYDENKVESYLDEILESLGVPVAKKAVMAGHERIIKLIDNNSQLSLEHKAKWIMVKYWLGRIKINERKK